jgi:hypothetical protein
MAFVIPLAVAAASAIGTAGAAIGTAAAGLFGAGTAATAATAATGAATAATAAAPAAAGIFGTGISAWQALSLGGSLFSGVASYSAAQQQASAYELQATNAVIQGNQQAQEYQKQGISVLNRTIETNALIRARGGAGGIDPYSGSAANLSDYAMSKGVDEFNWARSNSQMAIMSGQANQASNIGAASGARSMGTFNLIGSGLMGAARMKALA